MVVQKHPNQKYLYIILLIGSDYIKKSYINLKISAFGVGAGEDVSYKYELRINNICATSEGCC